ncbi:hypothetical protein [Paenibacillus xanthanilyticus]|uniref:Transcription elongation factor GreA/GreB C-terminal domain-containing protein n=1 Tax=Paenibacillus xanthanilyticus TaxID=1783531 RepID=A0ABV8K867_9BACL
MDQQLKRYYQLKNKHKEIEQELAELRAEITGFCAGQGEAGLEAGGYRAKLVLQERKEYDEEKLYAALPDPQLWRLLARPDSAKIASLLKLGVLKDEHLQGTFQAKTVTLLHVEKK